MHRATAIADLQVVGTSCPSEEGISLQDTLLRIVCALQFKRDPHHKNGGLAFTGRDSLG